MTSKSRKSISQLQKEIKDIEKRKKKEVEEAKRRELEEKLKRLKAKPKIGPRARVRHGLGKGVSGALDRASQSFGF